MGLINRSPTPTKTAYDGQRQLLSPRWYSGSNPPADRLCWEAQVGGHCGGGVVKGSERDQEERGEDGDRLLFLWEDEKGFQNQEPGLWSFFMG